MGMLQKARSTLRAVSAAVAAWAVAISPARGNVLVVSRAPVRGSAGAFGAGLGATSALSAAPLMRDGDAQVASPTPEVDAAARRTASDETSPGVALQFPLLAAPELAAGVPPGLAPEGAGNRIEEVDPTGLAARAGRLPIVESDSGGQSLTAGEPATEDGGQEVPGKLAKNALARAAKSAGKVGAIGGAEEAHSLGREIAAERTDAGLVGSGSESAGVSARPLPPRPNLLLAASSVPTEPMGRAALEARLGALPLPPGWEARAEGAGTVRVRTPAGEILATSVIDVRQGEDGLYLRHLSKASDAEAGRVEEVRVGADTLVETVTSARFEAARVPAVAPAAALPPGHAPRPWLGGLLGVPFTLLQKFNVYLGKAFRVLPLFSGILWRSYGRGAIILQKHWGWGRTLDIHLISPLTRAGGQALRQDVRDGMRDLLADAPRLLKAGYTRLQVGAHSVKVLRLFERYGFRDSGRRLPSFDLNYAMIERGGLLPADDWVLEQPILLEIDLRALVRPPGS